MRHANLNSYGGVDGPVAAMSRVTGIRDSVAGHKVYLKIEANNFAGEPADDAGGRGAHIEVRVSGEVNLGGQTITAVIPGVVVARTEDIYSKGCGGTCPANVYWAYYSSTQAGDFEGHQSALHEAAGTRPRPR